MSIFIKFDFNNGILKVTASGRDDNLDEVREYGIKVLEQALLFSSQKILCDERELKYNISIFDTFEAAQFISEKAPKSVKLALVCSLRNLPDAKFWETITFNRGLTTRIFTDIQAAEDWLNS